MGEVTISVAGRAYQVVCEDGEEDRLNAIAARVDHEAQAFGGATPSLSESRLLLMCSLLLADKLDEAEKAAPAADAPASAEVDISAIEDAAARIEALAGGDAGPDDQMADDTAPLQASEAEDAPEPAGETPSERRSKSSAAMAAEKDLLSWLDRPEPRSEEPQESAEEAAPAESAPEPEAEEVEQAETIAGDDAPAAEAEESDEERAARERSERRARRRARLARLAKHHDD